MAFFLVATAFWNSLLTPPSLTGQTLVTAPWGTVQGVRERTPSGQAYTRYEGIPYAEPPTGERRFTKPVAYIHGQGSTFVADTLRPSCWSLGPYEWSEDCLFVDVYVPVVHRDDEPIETMVFLHEGGFLLFGDYKNVTALMDQKVIVVLVHYRLAAFGFLSTGDDNAVGNYGLWDQHLAIKWTKDNIASFGGNPSDITIFGISAGSASVSYQVLAPPSKGLFTKAIMHSASVTSTWAFRHEPLFWARKLGVIAGCANFTEDGGYTIDNAQLVGCLRLINPQYLMYFTYLMRDTVFIQTFGDFLFVPVKDNEFVLDEPQKMIYDTDFLREQGVYDLDFLISFDNNEGALTFINAQFPKPDDRRDFIEKELIPGQLERRYGKPPTQAMIDLVQQFYAPDDLTGDELGSIQVSQVAGDPMFAIPCLESAIQFRDPDGGNKVFFYELDYCPVFYGDQCAKHSVEKSLDFPGTRFYFEPQAVWDLEDDKDRRLSENIVQAVTDFAKTGNPGWPEYEPNDETYMRMSYELNVSTEPAESRRKLWLEDLPELLN